MPIALPGAVSIGNGYAGYRRAAVDLRADTRTAGVPRGRAALRLLTRVTRRRLDTAQGVKRKLRNCHGSSWSARASGFSSK